MALHYNKQLYSPILVTYQLQKKILKDEYAKFKIELAKEAQNIDRADAASACDKQMQLSDSESDSGDSGYGGTSRKGSGKRGRRDYRKTNSGNEKSNKSGSGSGDKDEIVGKDKGHKRPQPSCVNPRCNENHLLKDCSKTSHEYAKNCWGSILKVSKAQNV